MAHSKRTSRGVTGPLLSPAPSAHKSKGSSVSGRTGTASSAGSDNHSERASTRIRASVYALDNSSDDQLCKRGLCFALHSSASAQVKATLKTPAPENMDGQGFGNLPLVIQRKYFSSTERLHYYQQTPVTPTASLPSSRHARNRSTGRIPLSQSTESFPSRSSCARPAKLRKHRNSESSARSPVDEQWLLDRQESLRKKLLAAEQRAALAERQEAEITAEETENTTDDMDGRTRENSLDSFLSKESVLDLERKNTFDTDIIKAREAARMSLRWMDEDGDLDLRLRQFESLEQDKYLSAPARTRSSILSRRTRSLTAKSREFFSNRPNLAPIRIVGSDPDDMLPPLTFEPGSPLHLDVATPTTRSEHEPDLGTDPELVPLPDSPREPKDIPLPNSRPTTASLLPLKCKPIADGSSGLYIQTPHGHREVTLRMTLTRKDLRDNDSILEEKVSLEELKPSDITTIDWDALDKESSTGLKKLWRKVKKT